MLSETLCDVLRKFLLGQGGRLGGSSLGLISSNQFEGAWLRRHPKTSAHTSREWQPAAAEVVKNDDAASNLSMSTHILL